MTKLTLAAIASALAGGGSLVQANSGAAFVNAQGAVVQPFVWTVGGRVLLFAAAILAAIEIARWVANRNDHKRDFL